VRLDSKPPTMSAPPPSDDKEDEKKPPPFEYKSGTIPLNVQTVIGTVIVNVHNITFYQCLDKETIDRYLHRFAPSGPTVPVSEMPPPPPFDSRNHSVPTAPHTYQTDASSRTTSPPRVLFPQTRQKLAESPPPKKNEPPVKLGPPPLPNFDGSTPVMYPLGVNASTEFTGTREDVTNRIFEAYAPALLDSVKAFYTRPR